MSKLSEKLKGLYSFWKGIWAREIAAGLTFYFLVGFVPALFLLTLVLKDKFPDKLMEESGLLSGLCGIADELVGNTERATRGASAMLIAASVYSSLNLFYRFTKCGEILYKYEPKRGGLAKRAVSFAFMILTVAIFVFAMLGYFYIDKVFSGLPLRIISALAVILLAFATIVILNLLVCPYPLSLVEVIKGSALTFALWLALTVGFSVYLDNFSDFGKLYGAFGGLFALMLYVYLIMQSFTFGVAYNILKLGRIKKRRFHK